MIASPARGCTVAAIILLAMTLLPGIASANPERLLQESIIRARLGEFQAALKLLSRARKGARGKPALQARIELQTGVVQGVIRKPDAARASFQAALKLDPAVELNREEVKRAVVELFEQVRAGLKGTLAVKADRAGAVITMDGKALGKAPFTGDVVIGRHKVVVSAGEGLYRHEQEVVVRADEEVRVAGKLAFVGGRLSVISLPTGAEVKVGDRAVGKTPIKNLELTAGEHEVTVTMAGRATQRQKIELKPGQARSVAVTLAEGAAAAAEPAPTPAPAAPEEPVAPAQPEPADEQSGFPVWTAVTGGAALAFVGVGIGMGVASRSAYEEYETTEDQNRWEELRDTIPTYDAVMYASYAAAGALAVTSVVLYFMVERHRPTRAETARVTPLFGPGSAALKVTF